MEPGEDTSAASQASQEVMDQDTVQHDIDKWVEQYDEIKAYLQHGMVKSSRNVRKLAENFTLGNDGNMYRRKPGKDGTAALQVLVIRNYEDRLRIVKDIHVNTGDEIRHHRRDRMLELVGQQYYWKGQRRDICECIASCEVCSVGLGGLRYSKPPGQARDVRSPAKLQKLSVSPLTVSSPIATSSPHQPMAKLAQPAFISQSVQAGGLRSEELPSGSTGNGMEVDGTWSTVGPLSSLSTSVSTQDTPTGADDTIVRTLVFDLGPIAATTSGPSPVDEVLQSSPSSAAGLQQIFTTIDVPATESFDIGHNMDGSYDAPPTTTVTLVESSSEMQFVNTSTQSSVPPLSNAVTHLLSTPTLFNKPETISVYQKLFQLPSQPNETLSTPVIEAMHTALKETVDPIQLSESAETQLRQILALNPSFSVLVTPNKAAAYTLAVAASMVRVDPLSIHPCISQSPPLTVMHDAYCPGDSANIQVCSALLGAVNWNLGTSTTPMDSNSLSSAIASNRTAAVFLQPYYYPEGDQSTQLSVSCGICRIQGKSVILDVDQFPVETSLPAMIIAVVKEWFVKGADFILLPKTKHFQGPPETCVLVGRSSLLKEVNVALLQPQICIPLTCPAYELVGTVVAYKTHLKH